MRKAANDPKKYVRRADLSPGAAKKIGSAHRWANPDRERRILEAMTSLEPGYIEV